MYLLLTVLNTKINWIKLHIIYKILLFIRIIHQKHAALDSLDIYCGAKKNVYMVYSLKLDPGSEKVLNVLLRVQSIYRVYVTRNTVYKK